MTNSGKVNSEICADDKANNIGRKMAVDNLEEKSEPGRLRVNGAN